MQLSLLAQATIQTIERYYLAVALLLQAGSGADHASPRSKQRCQLMAQRMTMLYGFNSPEFFDRTPVRELHRPAARARRRSASSGGGKLEFDEVLRARSPQDAQLVLTEQIRHSILQVTHSCSGARVYSASWRQAPRR